MRRNVENVTITFERDMLDWVENERGTMDRSPFVRAIIREKMNAESART